MRKLDSLRAFLIGYLPVLKRNPDKLDMTVSRGNLSAWSITDPNRISFEYRYTASIVIEDYNADPDTVFLPLTIWIDANQKDLFQNHDNAENQISYQVDRIDAKTYDIALTLPLTETVRAIMRPDGKGYDISHDNEAGQTDSVINLAATGALLKHLYGNGELLIPDESDG